MSVAPVNKLKKNEIIWLANHSCRHRHDYLSHYNCFLEEVANKSSWEPGKNIPIPHKIGFIDIENFGFKADFGLVLSWGILDSETGKVYGRHITKKELDTIGDRELVRECVECMKKFDKLVGFYSSKHDIPYLRSRAVFHKIPFPEVQDILHEDIYFTIKFKFKLSRSSQQSAYNMLVGESKKTHWGRNYWERGLRGDKEALGYIWEHNKIDCQELSELYYVVKPYSRRVDRSI